jgi:HEAT repeat protein
MIKTASSTFPMSTARQIRNPKPEIRRKSESRNPKPLLAPQFLEWMASQPCSPPPAPPERPAPSRRDLPNSDFGFRPSFGFRISGFGFLSHALLFALLLAPTALTASADDEQSLIATLKSTSSVSVKCTACVKLRVVGTVNAVPALAALLGDERTSQAARYTLEGMPFPEALAALRQALGLTSGLIKAGIIDSLGWRRDAAAVPLLIPLLSDADIAVASAAAASLGKIGSPQAIAALTNVRDTAPPVVRPAALQSLDQCAERLLAGGDAAAAAAIYRGLFTPKSPEAIRIAAWRGLVLADTRQRASLVSQALSGKDHPLHLAALKVLRELNDQRVVKACLREWKTLPANAQLAVLDARVKAGPAALPAVRNATRSPYLIVRVAAWKAFGDLGDASAIPALAKVAATGDPAERDAARETLERMFGPGVREALLKDIAKGAPVEKAELLRALGDRSDTNAANVLLQYATARPELLHLAALESLRKIAVPDTLMPLLKIVVQCKTDAECEPAVKALEAVCRATRDKEQATRGVLETLKNCQAAEGRRLLPLLAELGTPVALEAAQTAAIGPDPEVAKEAVRVLSRWPNAAPAQRLLELARTSANPTFQILALRGCIEVVAQESDTTQRFAILQQARAAAKRPDEKKQALGAIGQIPTAEALKLVSADLADTDLADEAGLAALAIAEKLANDNPDLAKETGTKLLAQFKNPNIVKRAWLLRGKPAAGQFIQDWLFSGPYTKAGVVGATAIFDVPFGPEKQGEKVQWKSVPSSEGVNLAAMCPGAENCAGYLKAQIVSTQECNAALLLGSDDGVKAWLNGGVVFSTNVDRGEIPDQDMAPVQLKQGTNNLMLKISQGGGGWSARARIVGYDGQPIPGLRVLPQAGAPGSSPAPAPAPATSTKPAELPKRDAFKKVRLSDQFYAEGAYYGDFNKDGQMDIVAGPFWFEGPDFQKRHEYRPAKAFDPKEYSDNFLTYVGDFNGDGWPDVLCVPFSTSDFRPSQMHALDLVDMNGDGLKDLVTGKRYWAHGPTGDKEPDAPAVLFWLELRRDGKGGATYIPHLIDDDSGVGTQVTATDLNHDGRPDIIVANKKGIFVHLSQ